MAMNISKLSDLKVTQRHTGEAVAGSPVFLVYHFGHKCHSIQMIIWMTKVNNMIETWIDIYISYATTELLEQNLNNLIMILNTL